MLVLAGERLLQMQKDGLKMSVLPDAGFCQKTLQIPVFSDKTWVLEGGGECTI